jgi:Zn-dependent M28 family amino/carboxypeptidase
MSIRWALRGVLVGLSLTGLALGGCARMAEERDVAAWWRTTADLSSDAMEGRDTGSAGYDRAAAMVADRFERAGLVPAGDGGTFFQTMPLHEVAVRSAGTTFAIARDDGGVRPLRFLHEITVAPSTVLPAVLEGRLAFRGYCSAEAMQDVRDKVVVCFAARRAGLPTAGERINAARAAGARAVINVDDPGFTVEPPRWPVAYSRSVAFAGADNANGPGFIVMRFNAGTFADLIKGSGQDAEAILASGSASRPLPSFEISAALKATFVVEQRDYASANVLGVLPGTDPALADQPVLLAAHLDGYGFGEAVDGDGLYNGALDDAAYVATLIQLAEKREGRGFRRPVIFAAFTGEEKGLLGSYWLAGHPTPNAPLPVAVLNLDQLRPLYPLTILTTLAVDESTLGRTVRDLAAEMGVEVRPDLEPERGLLRRSDHWPFMQKGVPAVSFIFGYDPGTPAEEIYRDWYRTRYHTPLDDITTPIDRKAAGDFNRFYRTLTQRVADADLPPQWTPGSAYAPAAAAPR